MNGSLSGAAPFQTGTEQPSPRKNLCTTGRRVIKIPRTGCEHLAAPHTGLYPSLGAPRGIRNLFQEAEPTREPG